MLFIPLECREIGKYRIVERSVATVMTERRVFEGRFKSEAFKTNERLRRLELKRVFPVRNGSTRAEQSAIRNNDSRER